MEKKKQIRKRRKKGVNYIDNKVFAAAVREHVDGVNEDLAEDKEPRQVSNYIAESFLKITTGLSMAPNFKDYSYREDMVMDAVENCIKAINNFDYDRSTRTGKPNPFSYFTQISYFAFLRRIAKEKKQSHIKQKLINYSAPDVFANFDSDQKNMGETMVGKMKISNDVFWKEPQVEPTDGDNEGEDFEKKAKRKVKDGPLNDFLN